MTDQPKKCPKCGRKILHAPGIGPFCPNKKCDVADGPFICLRCGNPVHADDPLSVVNCMATARQRICKDCGHKKGIHRRTGMGCFGDLPLEVMQWRTAPGPCKCPKFTA